MERIINPVRERWVDLLKRPQMENADLQKICKAIFAEVLKDGDKALVKYTWFFDQAKVERLQAAEAEFREAEREVSNDLKRAIPDGTNMSIRKDSVAGKRLEGSERWACIFPEEVLPCFLLY